MNRTIEELIAEINSANRILDDLGIPKSDMDTLSIRILGLVRQCMRATNILPKDDDA